MFRTSFKAAVVAAAVLAGSTLTGCRPVQAGAAAIVNGERITTSQLDSAVSDWRAEFARNADAQRLQQGLRQRGDQIPFDPDSPARSALYQIVDLRVWEEVARRKGIAVSERQIDQMISRGGGNSMITTRLLASDLPARYSRAFMRSTIIVRSLAQREGVVVDGQGRADRQRQQQGLRRVQAIYLDAARSLDIEVNPRYGEFDLRQGGLTAVVYRLSRVAPGTT